MSLARTDNSVVGRWWWTVDRWTLFAVSALILIGVLLTLAASPPVAQRIGADGFHFVRRQFIFLLPAFFVVFSVSMLNPRDVRRVAFIGFAGALLLTYLTLFIGHETKGATRWITLAGISLQPSEFLKPTFAVLTAWLFSEWRMREEFPGHLIAIGFLAMVVAVLAAQPDIGMTLVVAMVWTIQFFLAGLPFVLVLLLGIIGVSGFVGAYFIFPHVARRVDRFFDPAASESYQVSTAINAFRNGGFFGRGPGEGRIKASLPDAHTDFILAVAGEEFGLILCLLVVGLFTFVVLRAFTRLWNEENPFVMLAVSGLVAQFGLQALINMASTVHLIPTKGMTLPFISYGGSSMVALALGMGMLLALTRKHAGMGGGS
jgi:cell division protein FtsW